MTKVVVGMSGGVDSAVAAWLLKEAGCEVVGVTLRTWDAGDGTESRCCEIDEARQIAAAIGIPYHTLNCISSFEREVVQPFVREYLSGRTPNPCIGCNRQVKWEWMMYMAGVLQAQYVATGHYASVVQLPNGRYTVKKAQHAEKDQTYMLYRLTQEQLQHTKMPLGAYVKEDVRRIARELGLAVASKPDSQEICFVADGDYAGYIESYAEHVPGEGAFVDTDGNRIGTHRGIIHYTVGQRRGLGLPLGYPAYVREIRPETNEVVIGDDRSLYRNEIFCRDVCYVGIPEMNRGETQHFLVKIRYHHKEQPAAVKRTGENEIQIRFEEPVRAPAPGQSAVFYDEDGCLMGGGVIV